VLDGFEDVIVYLTNSLNIEDNRLFMYASYLQISAVFPFHSIFTFWFKEIKLFSPL